MKIQIRSNEWDSSIWFLSRKDNDDFEFMLDCLGMLDLLDDDGYPISDDTKEMVKAIQPETWDPYKFIELFNKVAKYNYRAELK